MQRGIRQVCPFTTYLYILTGEPFAERINANKNIKGMELGKHETNDVTSTTMIKDLNSIEHILGEFKLLKQATGKDLNENKTKIIVINKEKDGAVERTLKNQIKPRIKILRQCVGQTQSEETWSKTIQSIKKKLNSKRNLTWYEKRVIRNTVIAPKIMYHAKALTPTKETIRTLNRLFFNLPWFPEKIEIIARLKLIQSKKRGGMDIPHVESKIRSCKLEKIKVLTLLEELWHHNELYNLGPTIKMWNPNLYTISMPHRTALTEHRIYATI